MKALIFAAGLGTRLYPLTASRPKALVEVAGVPMLQRVIESVKSAGVTQVVVNVHHFADQIVDFLHNNRNFGIDIAVSNESNRLLETGGGLLAARPLLDGTEPILLHNADILTDLDLTRLQPAGDATLLVSDRKSSRRLAFDNRNQELRGWINTTTGETRPDNFEYCPKRHTALSFNGIHIFSPELFPTLSEYASNHTDGAFSITPFYIHCASHGAKIIGSRLSDYRWFDIGSIEKLAAAEMAIKGV